MTTKNKVVLGLSGGVDSTAAALLLQEKGYLVTGLFFDVLGNQETETEIAKNTANQLGIDFIYKDVSEEFEDKIIQYFCEAYANGSTPNPCVRCNPMVKFKVLMATADAIGAHHIATGHYAKVIYDEPEKKYYIEKGNCSPKDQSYMLYRLNQDMLSRLLLPLGSMASKDHVRELVKGKGISNAHAKDSQEICFVKGEDYVDFISKKGYGNVHGTFVNKVGNVIGQHKGLIHYTIGQRKGLGKTFGKPTFVIGINPADNTVMLGDNTDLFKTVIYGMDPFFTASSENNRIMPPAYGGIKLQAKIRYAAPPADAVLQQGKGGILRVEFQKPQRAAAAGQSVVFYQENRLLGGAVIQA